MNQLLQTVLTLMQSYWPWLLGAGILLGILILVRWIFSRRSTRDVQSRHVEKETIGGVFGAITPALAAQIPETEQESRDFGQLLRRAGLYDPTSRDSIYALRFVLLFIPIVITLILAIIVPRQFSFVVLIAGGFVAAGLSVTPRIYVYIRQQQRVREIRHGLADMMDMLSMCISGGLPIGASLVHVARNLTSYPALAQEIHILKRQADVGSLQHALGDFSSRIDIPEVRQLTSLLSRGDQLGTQLSRSLHEQSDHFRATRKQVATMQANRAPIKLIFPLVLCFAPSALILLMAPALLDVQDFVRNSEDYLGQSQLVEQIEQLDQQARIEIGRARTGETLDEDTRDFTLGQ